MKVIWNKFKKQWKKQYNTNSESHQRETTNKKSIHIICYTIYKANKLLHKTILLEATHVNDRYTYPYTSLIQFVSITNTYKWNITNDQMHLQLFT